MYGRDLFHTSANVIQWREKDLSSEANTPLIRLGSTLAKRSHKIFVVNSDVDLAMSCGADGVHLTSDQAVGPTVEKARGFGREFIIGKSIHSTAEALAEPNQHLDYLLLGPIFTPLSKRSYVAEVGLKGLRQAVQGTAVPVIALGGIDENTTDSVIETGVAGFAGITWMAREMGYQA